MTPDPTRRQPQPRPPALPPPEAREVPTDELRQVTRDITEAAVVVIGVQRKWLRLTGERYYGFREGPHDMPAWKPGDKVNDALLWERATAVWRDLPTVTEAEVAAEERAAQPPSQTT